MTDMAKHAEPSARKDHLWVVFVIAVAAAIEVCATWVGIGNVSGFPVIRFPFGWHVNTDFSLMVGMEAYGGFALYYWLSAAPGPRSRGFAMWSAIGALVLSLIGQVSYHILAAEHVLRPPVGVVGFVSSLPVVVLGFAAILVHLVHLDREEAAEAVRRKAEADRLAAVERTEADERTALRAELEAMREALAAAGTARSDAEQQAAEAAAETEKLTRKLAANSGAKKGRNAGARRGAAAGRTTVPKDVDARLEALRILDERPGISGRELGELCGRGERWGQMRKQEYAGHVTAPGEAASSDG